MRILPLAILLNCSLTACGFAAPADAPRPNVVLILADDMGFTDLGCYGGEIDTPNLDRLAAGGLRFTQFYNTGRCCPTRASLMTGLYPHAAGVGHMTVDRGLPGYTGDLNDRCRTIPEVLGPAGYRNYMAGKWHVTKHTTPGGPKHNWPTGRGFDHIYGMITGAGSFYDPPTLVRDGTMMTRFTDPDYQPREYYWTDAITDHAVRYLRAHERDRDDEPFFLYVAHTAAHWPMHALPEDIEKYAGRFDGGYEPVRRARFEKAKALGIIAADAELSPRFGDWEDVTHKAWEARCMEVYAAMVDRMDRNIGRLIDELERTGELDDTLILFLQDNGGCQEGVGRKPRKDHPTRPLLPPFEPTPLGEIRTDHRIERTRDGWPVLSGPGGDARPAGHLHRLRRGVGERVEHAVPPVQALRARGRHRHPADRPLARRHRPPRRTRTATRPPRRHRRHDLRPRRCPVSRRKGSGG